MPTLFFGVDNRTLSMAIVVNACMMAFALACVARGRTPEKGTGFWVAANSAVALGFAALFLRGVTPVGLSIVLANLFGASFYPLMHRGLSLFHGRRPSLWPLLYPVAAGAASLLFVVVRMDVGPRLVVLLLIEAAGMAHMAFLVHRVHRPNLAKAQRLLSIVFIALALVLLLGAVRALFWTSGRPVLSPDLLVSAFFLAVLLGNTAWTLALLFFLYLRASEERVQLAANLQDSEAILEMALRAAQMGAWEYMPETRRVTWAAEHAALFGKPIEEFNGTLEEVLGRIHPEDQDKVREYFLNTLATGTGYSQTYRSLWPDGTVRWLRCHGAVLRDGSGKPERILGVTQDITEHKHAEQALRESEQLYRDIFEKNRAIKLLIEPDSGQIVEANSAACRFYGYNRERLASLKIWDLNVLGEQETRKWMAFARTGEQTEFEFRHRLASGEVVDVQVFSGEVEADGRPLLHSIVMDITARKQAEEALRRSEARVRKKLDSLLMPESEDAALELADVLDVEAVQKIMDEFYALTHVGVGIIDLQGNVLVGTGWQDICTGFHRRHPQTQRHCIKSDTVLSSGVAPGTFKAYRCENNMWDIVTPIHLGERHVGNLFLGQFFYDDEEIDYELFRAQARKYGFDAEAYLAALERAPRFSRATVDAAMRFYARVAQFISLLSHSNVRLARTLAERDRLLDSLRESEERYRNLVEGSPDIIYVFSTRHGARYWSQRVRDILGYEPEWLATDPFAWRNAIHPEDRKAVIAAADMATAQTHFDIEYRIQDRHGGWHWLRDRSIRISEAGDDLVIEGLATDITARKQAEEALRHSLVDLRLAQRIADIGNWSYDPETNVATWSEQVYAIYERDPAQGPASYSDYQQLFPHAEWQKFDAALQAAIHEGLPCDIRLKATVQGGEERWVRAICEPDPEAGPAGHFIRGTIQDITRQVRLEQERLALERRILETRRAESLSTLAGGIAHDFNNLLYAVLGGTELLADAIPPSSPDREILDTISSAADRAAELARQMLAYSGHGLFTIEKANLNGIVRDSVDEVRASIAGLAELHLDLDSALPAIEADPRQMRQVVTNLLVNAAEAIGEQEGEVHVRTYARAYTAQDLQTNGADNHIGPGNYVTLEVTDSGPGVETEDLEMVFEPFYSTKFAGRGLGLAAALGIVQGHKGAILVESERGAGARFRVLLPPAQAARPRSGLEQEGAGNGGRERRTVLLVDDEPSVRAMAGRMLRRLGLETLLAASGPEALDLYEKEAARISFVLLDFAMPGMPGEAVCRKLHALDPDARIIMMSGFSEYQVTEEVAGLPIAGFIHKPFRLAALKQLLDELAVL